MNTASIETAMASNSAVDNHHRYFYTEECGLALFMNTRTGNKSYMIKECWDDLVHYLQNDWISERS